MQIRTLIKRVKRIKSNEDFLPQTSSVEARICLNCPLPECVDRIGKECEYLKSEIRRLRGPKNEKCN